MQVYTTNRTLWKIRNFKIKTFSIETDRADAYIFLLNDKS